MNFLKILVKSALIGCFLAVISSKIVIAQECVYQSRTYSVNSIEIDERSNINRDVIDIGNGNRKCIVNFSVRINNDWYMASGEWEWSGDRPHQQACAKAVQIAEKNAIERIGNRDLTNEQVLICNDDQRYEELTNISKGTVGSINQFQPHPDKSDKFLHRGTVCKWFINPVYTGNDIESYEGIICKISSNKWVVRDLF